MTMTQDEIDAAVDAIMEMRPAGEQVKSDKRSLKLQIDHKLDELAEKRAGEDDYEFHGINLTETSGMTEDRRKQLTAASNKSTFGKFVI